MKDFLHHLFLPRESNNHRSKILHHKILFFAITILLILNLAVALGKNKYPNVLGDSINVGVEKLLELTNQRRLEKGLPRLKINNELSDAARLKAGDMFEKNYWAHSSPVGDTPWIFFKKSGYDYVYAGENLARGFSNSEEIVSAWMKSPSHRENLLSENYSEIGFAVLQGNLLGEETTLVVQLFGSRQDFMANKSEKVVVNKINSEPKIMVASVKTNSLIDANMLTKNASLIILLLFISVFILDMIVIERKKIIRLVGHNLDHILFLSILLGLVLLLSKGTIL